MGTKILGVFSCVAMVLVAGVSTAVLAQGYDQSQMRPYDEMQRGDTERDRDVDRDRDMDHDWDRDRIARPLITVEEFRAGGRDGDVVADNMRALLITALRRDGRFALPRYRSRDEEKDADIYVEGTVTRYKASPAPSGMQFADVEIALNVIDGASGRAIGTVNANGTGTGGDVDLSRPMDAASFSTTGMGRAGNVALSMAVPRIAEIVRRAHEHHDD